MVIEDQENHMRTCSDEPGIYKVETIPAKHGGKSISVRKKSKGKNPAEVYLNELEKCLCDWGAEHGEHAVS